jgi:cytochrome c5
MSSDQHSSPIKTPRQLITLVVLAFVVPVILIILLVTFVTGEKVGGAGTEAMTPEAVAERLRPVGSVAFAGASSGPKTLQSGEAVYKLACSACHATGAAGAPKAGDAGAWAPRIKQGYDTLVKHAVEGFKGMPAKGGNADLDPMEVARAVVFIANQAGAKFKEPEATAAPGKATARTGEQIVQATCGNCHTEGLEGAPKIGDRAAWTKRASNGIDAAVASAIKGHGHMPSRGGMSDLTDAELKSAVQYMFLKSTGAPAK